MRALGRWIEQDWARSALAGIAFLAILIVSLGAWSEYRKNYRGEGRDSRLFGGWTSELLGDAYVFRQDGTGSNPRISDLRKEWDSSAAFYWWVEDGMLYLRFLDEDRTPRPVEMTYEIEGEMLSFARTEDPGTPESYKRFKGEIPPGLWRPTPEE